MTKSEITKNTIKLTIYGIKDKRTDEIKYIGQTSNLTNRKYKHLHEHNRPVTQEIYRTGVDNIEFVELDVVGFDEVAEAEKRYIKKYDTKKNGWNQNDTYKPISIEGRRKISKLKKGRNNPMFKVDFSQEELKEMFELYYNNQKETIKKLSEKYNCSPATICNILNFKHFLSRDNDQLLEEYSDVI
ncbi:GIY-YIG nuclease family protein [Orenia marismortui]|uniref:GIY-YIG nuclease family protein n=1 Tax=Orenia marismortui TaxID=46469 RepID=UPI001461329D|nr:GIY-YIG nuclease family protein [Orenia marismortui]